MRRFPLAVIVVLLCAAPAPAWASGPRASDFELAVPAPAKARAASATWTSPVLRPVGRFDVFGLRWERATEHVELQARVRDPWAGWRRWVNVGHAHSVRGSDPVWAGGADALQVRVRGRARGLRAHFVAVSAAPRRARAARRAQATGAPPIVPRADWAGDQCNPRDAPTHGEVRMAFVHHTVTANEYAPEDSREMVLGVCRYHRNSNGWDDIGYNFLVDKYGVIFEGRAGGIDQAIVGAQAQGYNHLSTGVANLGSYEAIPQSDAAIDALARLLAWKLPLHGAPVEGQHAVVSRGGSSNRYPSGQSVTFERIAGHRDGNATACPGAQLYAQLPRVRELAAGRAPAAAPPPVTGVPAALTLQPVAPAFPFPAPVRLAGRMTDATGAGVAGRKVTVQIATTKGWRPVTTTTSGPDGAWSAEFPATRSWDVRAIHNEVRSPRARAVVVPALAARLAARRVTAGRSAVIVGSVRPRKPSLLVEGHRQDPRRPTRFVRAFTVRRRAAAGGRFRAAVPLRRPGLYRLRVRFAGDRRNGPAQAADLFVRAVRGPTGGTAARAGR
jgi:N-acetylmuramoyl-L-alanine amidase